MMKHTITKKTVIMVIASAALFHSSKTLGQWTNTTNINNTNTGTVGIGTVSTSAKLGVLVPDASAIAISSPSNAIGATAGIEFNYCGSTGGNAHNISRIMGYTESGGGGDIFFQTAANATAGYSTMMTIFRNGNVSIGNSSPNPLPTAKLQVYNGSISVYSSNGNNSLFFGQDQMVSNQYGEWGIQYVTNSGSGTGGLNFWKPSGNDASGYNNFGNYYLFLRDNGNVGIGTNLPAYLLDVNGTMRANEVKVCLFGTCDFVFDKGYKLMSLDTLNMYLKQNHHLPEIASASEMEAEGNVSLGKLDSKLLQKVEELTLYVIQEQQKIKELETALDKLNKNLK